MTYSVSIELSDIATGKVIEAAVITDAFNALKNALESVGNGVAPFPENLTLNAPDAATTASITISRGGLPRYRITLVPDPDPLTQAFALLRLTTFNDLGNVQVANALSINALGEVGIGQNPVSGIKFTVQGDIRCTSLTETSP